MADMLYEIFFPAFPKIHKPWFYVFARIWYYLAHYGALAIVSYYGLKKTEHKADYLALQSLLIYTIGKFIFYIFIANYDMPSYIDICNSKPVAISFSILLWGMSVAIWYKRFKIKKLFKNKFHGRRKI
jgi:hypothetical protein